MATIRNKDHGFYWDHILIGHDGNKVFARFNDFTNLQESPSGFGDSNKEAVMDILQDADMHCGQPMWFGYGGPAGHCREKAYGGEVHPNTLDMFMVRRERLPRCPNHGGVECGASAALALIHNCKEAPEGFLETE